MVRALGASALLAVALSCAAKPQLDAGSRYFAVHNVLGALGLTPVGSVTRTSLVSGQELKVELSLPATCWVVVALGGSGVGDLWLSLTDGDGQAVEQEREHGPEAVARACVEQPGVYQASVRMAEGSGELVLASWLMDQRGTAASTATSAPGGTCEAPTPLALGRSYTGNTDDAEDLQEGSCSSSGGHEHVFRLDIAARQRITATVAGDFDTVLYLRKGNCADDNSEVRCNDDAGPKRSRIDAVLEPGVYFVFVDGYGGEAGNYHLQVIAHPAPSIADLCRTARALPAGSNVVGTLTDTLDNANATCGREAKGGDAPFRFDLAARSRVRFTERSSEFAPVVHVRRVCSEPGSEVACSDRGFAGDEEATWAGTLDAGSYWVYADAADELAQGAYSLRAETAPEPGAGSSVPGESCADATPLSSAAGGVEGDTFAARHDVTPSCAVGSSADVVYRLEVARRSRLMARLAGDESAHVLALEHGCGDDEKELACGAIVDQILEPGTYFLVVDGARPGALGRFAVSYRLRDLAQLEQACTAPRTLAFGATVSSSTHAAGNKFGSSCGSVAGEQAAPDRVFRFTVPRRMPVRLSLRSDAFRGVLSLRRSCLDQADKEVECSGSDAGGAAEIAAALNPGVYYAVVDGWSSGDEGRFTLHLEPGK